MSISKITTAPQPIDEVNKINEIIDNMAYDSAVVHTTGDENIGGVKTFTDTLYVGEEDPVAVLKHTGVTKGTAPSVAKAWAYVMSDKNGGASVNRLAQFSCVVNTEGTFVQLRAYKNASGSTDAADIRIAYPASGDPYTNAPASTVTNSMVTTTSLARSSGNISVGFGNTLKITTKEITLTANSDTTFSYGITFGATPVVLLSRRTNATTTGTAYPAWVRGSTGTSSCKIYSNVAGTCMAMAIGY